MKFAVLSSSVAAASAAQTVMEPGDCAVVALKTDNPDHFSIVLTRALKEGDVLYATDAGVSQDQKHSLYFGWGGFRWEKSTTAEEFYGNGGFRDITDEQWRSYEGFGQFKVPAGGLPAGSIITSEDFGDHMDEEGITKGEMALSTAGDQVFIFTGPMKEVEYKRKEACGTRAQSYTQSYRQSYTQTYNQPYTQSYRQTYSQKYRQTYRQSYCAKRHWWGGCRKTKTRDAQRWAYRSATRTATRTAYRSATRTATRTATRPATRQVTKYCDVVYAKRVQPVHPETNKVNFICGATTSRNGYDAYSWSSTHTKTPPGLKVHETTSDLRACSNSACTRVAHYDNWMYHGSTSGTKEELYKKINRAPYLNKGRDTQWRWTNSGNSARNYPQRIKSMQWNVLVPTMAPTQAPTDAPTDAPTNAPTDAPTDAPTNFCDASNCLAWNCAAWCRCYDEEFAQAYVSNGCEDDGDKSCVCFEGKDVSADKHRVNKMMAEKTGHPL